MVLVFAFSFGLAAVMMTAAAHAEGWTVEKVTTNLEVVSLNEAELSARRITPIALGVVELPTGHVVATDLVQPQAPALSRAVKPGRYPVTLYDAAGNLVANSVNRFGFTSQEIVRAADGTFAITVSPRASAGNWLPTGGIERYRLMIRLYDTPVGVSTRAGKEVPMPTVATTACPKQS